MPTSGRELLSNIHDGRKICLSVQPASKEITKPLKMATTTKIFSKTILVLIIWRRQLSGAQSHTSFFLPLY